MKFIEKKIKLPKHDADVVLVLPGGKKILIQLRPSNADINYNGSLDIILPEDIAVTNWKGEDMQPAPSLGDKGCTRLAQQLVMELPGDYS